VLRRSILPLIIALALGAAAQAAEPAAARPVAETIVYVTNTGTKYHVDGCRYLSKSKIRMTLEDAKRQGYEPCSVCRPPR